jgi:CRISPR-associated protein Csx3
MKPPFTVQLESLAVRRIPIPSLQALDTTEFADGSGRLRIQFLETGALLAVRHEGTLINQVMPGPAGDGLFRLFVRTFSEGGDTHSASLVGAGRAFRALDGRRAYWPPTGDRGVEASAALELSETDASWTWSVSMENRSDRAVECDVVLGQDLGLADEGAVRNNEAYTSHYVDLLPYRTDEYGVMLFARQNQRMHGGRYPWLGLACTSGADAYCTDGWQFFGRDHRATGVAPVQRGANLPSARLQYECAFLGLQSRRLRLQAGESRTVGFVCVFSPHHDDASGPADALVLARACARARATLEALSAGEEGDRDSTACASILERSRWLHGDCMKREDWDAWFPEPRRFVERGDDGGVSSFFHGQHTHVVAGDKEAVAIRPHGHLLRSGDSEWIDREQFGLTAYAAGIFSCQVYYGNPSFARLLPVARNALGLGRAGGQRMVVEVDGEWRMLGIPSAFAMSTSDVRWLYRIGDDVLEIRVWCAADEPASFLSVRSGAGRSYRYLISHELLVGSIEYEHATEALLHAGEHRFTLRPSPDGLLGRREPGVAFAIVALDTESVAACGGDEMLFPDGLSRNGGYAVIRTHPTREFGVCMTACRGGGEGIASKVAAIRERWRSERGSFASSVPPELGIELEHPSVEVRRIAEILPWFNHNASIHFSAPHGLEQSGGAAWGVRDVCQGSLEWLLARGDAAGARRMLLRVFSAQYAEDGTWPQWFMHEPYADVQQRHCHGDVCFWPIKALCDYVAATDDRAVMSELCGYTDPDTARLVDPRESLWAHCDRVLEHVATRFLGGTTLVDYGDGDWDDTLQPADPSMRTRMTSAWTVALAYHAYRQFAELCRLEGRSDRASRLETLLGRMRDDFSTRLMPSGIVAGFAIREPDATLRPILHPQDESTGIRYRLLPMTRAVLAELFTPEEAARHVEVIENALRYPDGVRLMSEPARYRGGRENLFKRGDTAANVGREIGLQYVHAHLRYAEAMAKLGHGDALWWALQVVNPVALSEHLPNAEPRQANVYFSSSDADFPDRLEAAERWEELREGRVPVRAGWRLYSSGPGLFLHKVRTCLLGIREHYGDVVFDPVLPRSLDGLRATLKLLGRSARVTYRTSGDARVGVRTLVVNGRAMSEAEREVNPYRPGGLRVPRADLARALRPLNNEIEVEA